MVVEVTFKGNRREFFDWPFPEAPAAKTPVIVAVERGEDLGRVHATGELARKRRAGTTHGHATRDPLRKILRAANGEEIERAAQLRTDEYNVRVRAIEKVRSLGLDLKVSDTEWQWDRKRLTIYFTSDERVDFRQLVRQLEGLFGTRVHMWHIGVRDEARRVDGVGRCGRQLCSAGWLPELVPVKSSVAKDQHLSTLNPAQISGACGRLMCCLRYEHEFYVAQRKRFPKEGRIIRTGAGEEKVLSLDIFRETVTLRSVEGEVRVVPLARLRQELQGERPAWADRIGDESAATAGDQGVDTGDAEAADSAIEGDEGGSDRSGRALDRAAGFHSMEADHGWPPERVERVPPREHAPRARDERPRDERQRDERQRDERQRDERQRDERPRDGGAGREGRPYSPPKPAAPTQSATPGQSAAPGQPPNPGQPSSPPGSGRRRRRGRRGGRRGRGGPPGSPPPAVNPPPPPRNDEPHE